LGIPIVIDLPFGHDGENVALPCGAIATIHPRSATLSIDHSGLASGDGGS
jgi:muramoyltetrapeptide carboxypeptidase